MKIQAFATSLRLMALGIVLAVMSYPASGADRTFQSGTLAPNAAVYGEIDRLLASTQSLLSGTCQTSGCSRTFADPIRISVTAAGYGPILFEVTKARMPNTIVETIGSGSLNLELPILLKGKVRLRHIQQSGKQQTKWIATSGALFRHSNNLVLELVLPNFNAKRDAFSLIRRSLFSSSSTRKSNRNGRVISSAKGPAASCGRSDAVSAMDELLATSRTSESRNEVSTKAGEIVNVAILGDFRYFQSVGAGSVARILSTMNEVDTIYQRDIEATLNVSRVVVRTTSTGQDGSINSSVLLTSFTQDNNDSGELGASDAYILATGRDIEGNVLGLANVAQLCRNRSLSYGLIQRQTDLRDIPTLAHELGHIFGLVHSTDGGIMAPSLGAVLPQSFSPTSIQAGKAYLNATFPGTCIGRAFTAATATPTPRPTATRTATPIAPTPTRTPVGPPPPPTSTPRGGSGSNPGSGDPRLPAVSLVATVDNDGTVEATLGDAAAISGTCEATLYGGFTPILARSRATTLGSGDFTDGNLSIDAQVNGSATKANSTTPIKVYLYGRIVCDGVAVAESESVAVNTNRIKVFRKVKGSRKRVTFASGKWFKQFAKTVLVE